MNVAFLGTPNFAVPTLEAIAAAGHRIAAVYTQPDRPKGRGQELAVSPVKEAALKLGLSVRQPERIRRPEPVAELAELRADVIVVVGYGQILPQAIIDLPRLGVVNVHASLLPRWRGAAPIHRAIMAGDDETGVMVMKMDAGLDTGDVAMAERMAITDAMTAGDLNDALARLGGELMARAIGALECGKLHLTRQSEQGVTYAAKIEKAEARINWNGSVRVVLRHIHGLSPFPGAWCEIPIDGEPVRVKILRGVIIEGLGAPGEVLDEHLSIACQSGALRILQLQRAGKAPMNAEEFLRGTPLRPPLRLP